MGSFDIDIISTPDVNWPSISYDSRPLDYFLWVYAKSEGCRNNPRGIPPLKDRIIRVISEGDDKMTSETEIVYFIKDFHKWQNLKYCLSWNIVSFFN